MSDLIKRLRELEDFSEGVGRLSTADLLGEAAGALEQKDKRIAELERTIEAFEEITNMTAEVLKDTTP